MRMEEMLSSVQQYMYLNDLQRYVVGSKATEVITEQVASLLRASEYSSPTALHCAPKVTPREAK
jgi:hypothetical protein